MAEVRELCFTVSSEGGTSPIAPKHFGLVPGAVVKIGRAVNSDIVLTQKGISAQHTELRVCFEAKCGAGLHLFARDVSTNGTGVKRSKNVAPVALEKDRDELVPDGALLVIPLRTKDPNAERAWLRVQYEEPTSAPSTPVDTAKEQTALETAAPGQRCLIDPYGNPAHEEAEYTESLLDQYLENAPRRARTETVQRPPGQHSKAVTPVHQATASSRAKTPPPRASGYAKKASALPPALQGNNSSSTPAAPAPPGRKSGAAAPPDSRKAPPPFSPLVRAPPSLPAPRLPPDETPREVGARPKSTPLHSQSLKDSGVKLVPFSKASGTAPKDRRINRSRSPRQAALPGDSRRQSDRRRSSRSRSPYRKPDPAPPPPPQRAGHPPPIHRPSAPWEMQPPPSTWDGPAPRVVLQPPPGNNSSWSGGSRRWEAPPQERVSLQEASSRYRSDSGGDRRRRHTRYE